MKCRTFALPAALALALLVAGCSSASSHTDSSPSAVESAAVEKTSVTDTSDLPKTKEVMATVAAAGNVIAITMSTGGVLSTTATEIVGVDGTGSEMAMPVPTGTVVTLNSTVVGTTPIPLTSGTSVCVSIPDPSEPGQYVKMDVAGSSNMTFGGSELSTTPCLG